MDGSGSDQPTPQLRKKRVGWDYSSAPTSPPNGGAHSLSGRRHAPGEPDANELSRALQILVTDTETTEPSPGPAGEPPSFPPSPSLSFPAAGPAAAAAAISASPHSPPGSTLSPGLSGPSGPSGPPPPRKPVRPVLRRNTSYQSRNNSDDEGGGGGGGGGTMTPRMLQGSEAAAGARARADHLAASISRRNSVDSEDDDVVPDMLRKPTVPHLPIPQPAHHPAPHHHHHGHHPAHGAATATSPLVTVTTTASMADSRPHGLGILSPATGASTPVFPQPDEDDEEKARRHGELAIDDPEYARIQNLKAAHKEAEKLVRSHSKKGLLHTWGHQGHMSGTSTPLLTDQSHNEYFPRPNKYHTGILGTLLKLYDGSSTSSSSATAGTPSEPGTPLHSPAASRRSSFASTTRSGGGFAALYSKYAGSTSTLTDLMRSSGMFAAAGGSGIASEKMLDATQNKEHGHGHGHGHGGSSRKSRKQKEAFKITLHIAGLISRQRYIVKLCHALMIYGAPTHRLEVFLSNTAKVLEIDASFLYIPGCMIICFNDNLTHTSEMRLVRHPHGLDLGKLRDVHDIYKHVVNDRISVDEAMVQLEAVMAKNSAYPKWVVLIFYGLASLSVGPFGFNARWIDLPLAFLLGLILGVLTLYAAPANENFASILEVAAAMVTAFLARAFGSIRGGDLFCFSALAQSAIALILPGWLVLSASLELQSQQLVAGSVRMVYALIYTIFLGYGITMGSVIWGAMAREHAISETTCRGGAMPWYYNFFFVSVFTISLSVINQARPRQMPAMVAISLAGWVVNRFAGLYFVNSQISSMFGALVIGVLANTYSRNIHSTLKSLDRLRSRFARRMTLGSKTIHTSSPSSSSPATSSSSSSSTHLPPPSSKRPLGSGPDPECAVGIGGGGGGGGDDSNTGTTNGRLPKTGQSSFGYGLAAAAMLPAIFVQVPSGLAISGSLIAGIDVADSINNGTATSSFVTVSPAFTVLFGVIQVAIGIAVGLFISTLLVYLFGRRPKKSAVFTL